MPSRSLCSATATRAEGDAAARGRALGRPVGAAARRRPDEADLIVDALFGAGLARDLDGAARAAVEAHQRRGPPGPRRRYPGRHRRRHGPVARRAVRATATVTFFRRKPGHCCCPGRAHCGPVAVADIGIADAAVCGAGREDLRQRPRSVARGLSASGRRRRTSTRAATPSWSPAARHAPARRGSPRAARCGSAPGSSRSPRPAEALAVNAAHLTAIMLRRCDGADGPARAPGRRAPQRRRARAGARGRRRDARTGRGASLGADRATVLDADALTSFAGDAAALAASGRGAGRRARRRADAARGRVRPPVRRARTPS